MKSRIAAICCAAVLLLSAIYCSWVYLRKPQIQKPVDYANAVITLERTMCFGSCPVYELTIHGDGKVEYRGGGYVRVTGLQTADIPPDAVKGLVDEFYRINYFNLHDEYRTVFGTTITDLPTEITSITIDGKTKRVVDYYGAPGRLEHLERKIDEVAGTKQWVDGYVPPNSSSAVITLERTACFGTCPVYKLTIHGDGKVEYEGEQFVKITGSQTENLRQGDVEYLIEAFEGFGYFALEDEYRATVTDMATTITSITVDGKTKRVLDYGDAAPQGLRDLEDLIDWVVRTDKWIKGE